MVPQTIKYALLVHPDNRSTMSGDMQTMLHLMKLTNENEYYSHLKDLSIGIYESTGHVYIGEYIHNDELMHVFIKNVNKLIEISEDALKKQLGNNENFEVKITKIVISDNVKKLEPACVKITDNYNWENQMEKNFGTTRKYENEVTGQIEILENYPYEYDIENPIFRFDSPQQNPQETTQESTQETTLESTQETTLEF